DPLAVVGDDGVVVDGDVARAAGERQEVAVAAPRTAVDICEEIVADDDRLRLLARVVVVVAENTHAGPTVAHRVLLDRDVVALAPRTVAVLIADREEDRVARLAALPVVVERIADDRDPARVLQLEDVLHHPVLIAP